MENIQEEKRKEEKRIFDEAYKAALAKRKPELETLKDEKAKKYSFYRKKYERALFTPFASDVAPKNFLLGVGSWIVGMIVSKCIRDGGIREIDKDRAYFASHPEALEKVKEVLGTDNLDYIVGYIRGSDGTAQALFVDCGLKDFYFNNGVQGVIDGAITGLLVFAVPTLLCFGLNAIRYKKAQKASMAVDEVENKIKSLENEAKKQANEVVEAMKNKKEQKANIEQETPALTLGQ